MSEIKERRFTPVKCPKCGKPFMVNKMLYYECTVCEGRMPARRDSDHRDYENKVLNENAADWA